MNNKEINKEINKDKEIGLLEVENYIQQLTVLKLKKHYELITEKEFYIAETELTEKYGQCDYVEELSIISFIAIVERINGATQKDNIMVYFLKKVKLPEYKEDSYDVSEVVIVGDSHIEAIKILSKESNKVNAAEDINAKLLAMGITDKLVVLFPEAKKFITTIIQPNLMNISISESPILDILHQLDHYQ